MAESHDGAVGGFCGDFELFGQALAFDDERMVTRRGEALGEVPEDRLPVVDDFAGLAMKEFRRAHDFSAKGGANGLVPQAHAEDGDFSGKPLDYLHGDARLLRGAGTRRDDNLFRAASGNFVRGNFVVAAHLDIAAQLAEILREVVGEGVVVVQQSASYGPSAKVSRR